MHDTESDRAGLTLTRRRLLGGLVVGGAAALGHAARGSAATEWEQAVAAAKKEGKVAVNTFTGQGFARVFKLFSHAHPDIKLDHTNLEPVDFVPRVTTERRAGLYTWDVCTMPMSTALQVLKPAGVWDPCGRRSSPPRPGTTRAGAGASRPASSTATDGSPTPSRWCAPSASSSTSTG